MALSVNWLLRFSSWTKASVFIGLNLVIQTIILFVMYPAISTGIDPLDVHIFLTSLSIDTFLTSIGESGRALYFINEMTFDMLFPIIYAFAYALLFIELFKLNKLAQSRLINLALLPFMIAVADVVENIHILISLELYPVQHDVVIYGLSIANMVKHSLIVITLVVVLLLVFRVFVVNFLSLFKSKGEHDG